MEMGYKRKMKSYMVTLPPKQREILKKAAKAMQLSQSEVVRRAIDFYLIEQAKFGELSKRG